ncbi:C-type lectin 37Db-like [Drosophila innubila]|uniref:C-type lectin 37Db-like n=1 Tax=Drosophila innubila TaxID=198719 RepID=UPI00148D695F|nr:C-type lectin 37Db-like [Drosophila innubila]
MKIVIIGLLVTIFAIHESQQTYAEYAEYIDYLDQIHQIKTKPIEDFTTLSKKFDDLEKKFEDLRKTVTAVKTAELPKFVKIGSKYYYIDHAEEVNWFVAVDKCRAMDANLAGLQSMEELKAVSDKLTERDYWLDINDLGKKGVYQTLSSGQNAGFLNWHDGEPNNGSGNERCVVLRKIRSKYAMNDEKCEIKHHFICQKNQLE